MLTGTPLQNNVDELFSLLSFLEPRQFSSSETFMAEFGRLETESQVDKLKAVCRHACHRITLTTIASIEFRLILLFSVLNMCTG